MFTQPKSRCREGLETPGFSPGGITLKINGDDRCTAPVQVDGVDFKGVVEAVYEDDKVRCPYL